MTEPTLNDNDSADATTEPQSPDAHGQAAMLLAESMLHGLIARKVISVADAVEIVEVAADLGDTPATMRKSLALLGSIRLSLRNDLPAGLD